MNYQVFSVRDRAADTYGRPMFVASRGVAVRSFIDEVNRKDPQNQLNVHPEDFDLYFLGTFNDLAGSFDTVTPVQVVVGKDVVVRD